MTLTLAELNALPAAEAGERFRSCCGASRWVAAMVAGRPYPSLEALLQTADRAWAAAGPADREQAFAHHPRIGEREARTAVTGLARAWSAGEQRSAAGDAAADSEVARRLAEGNRAYEERFGRTYIVCATGRSAAAILADLEARLGNDPEREQEVAAEEQRRITALRLRKLLGAGEPQPTGIRRQGDPMPSITTHVLDTRAGRPAAGLAVRLELVEAGGNRPVASGRTDADGRIRDWLPDGVPPGEYRLVFETGPWFTAAGHPTLYPEVCVHFTVAADQSHYHVPLLLAPFGYTTYRGS